MDDSKVRRYVCTRVLLEDGETFKPAHFRVVALGDYDDAMMRIGALEAVLRRCERKQIGSDDQGSIDNQVSFVLKSSEADGEVKHE